MKRYIFIKFDNTIEISQPFESEQEFLTYSEYVRKEGTTCLKVKDSNKTKIFEEQLKQLFNKETSK